MTSVSDERIRREMGEVARACLARYLAIRTSRRSGSATSPFAVSEQEAELAARPAHFAPPEELPIETERIGEATEALEQTLGATPEPRLARLMRVCQLGQLDMRILCVLLAPELDDDIERGYMYALDDFTRKRPDLRFVARMIGGTDAALVDRVLTRFDDAAPLRRHGVVVLGASDGPSQLRQVRLADRIVAFFRGHDTIDELVRGHVRLGRDSMHVDQVVMSPELVTQIRRALLESFRPPRLLLAGPEGTGRGLIVEALMAEAGREVLRVDLAGIAGIAGIAAIAAIAGPAAEASAAHPIAERVAAALREAALRDAAVILDGAGAGDDLPRSLVQAIAGGVEALSVPIVFAFEGHPGWLVRTVPELVELDVPAPSFRERHELWRRSLEGLADSGDLETVASRYRFTAATIAHAAHRAASCARLRDGESPRVTLDDLGDAARLMFSHRLGTMAQRIPTGFAWSDLVLPKDTLDGLHEIVMFARYKPFLLEEWGFAAKLPYGRGVSAILAGPPGTGKTMVAQLLAKEIGFDLYRIDLSQVVNKYIGETEKNLARIFDEAEHSHAVLFFDEADSLFAKRTSVQSSNDRYANLEVNYLLQRMETFDGVTLLATNLEQGLDEAFKRRVRFTVQFELPDRAERKALWRSMFPSKVPLAGDIDWELIAGQFEMAGGYIKKAALRAALMAAESRRPITTEDLLAAGRHEYREMGRII
jgi:DNA polymerase III delta prime subunit